MAGQDPVEDPRSDPNLGEPRSPSSSPRSHVFSPDLSLNHSAESLQMEHFTRECLEMDVPGDEDKTNPEANMQRVYQEAATLVRKTLDVDGALVLDVSHFEVMETLVDSDDPVTGGPKRAVFYHADLYDMAQPATSTPDGSGGTSISVTSPNVAQGTGPSSNGSAGRGPGERAHEFGSIPALPVLGRAESRENLNPLRDDALSGDDHAKISKFLTTCTEGKIYERLPSCFRRTMPNDIQYAMSTFPSTLCTRCARTRCTDRPRTNR